MPKTFDCTGLTMYAVYQVTGKILSHDGHQANEGGQLIHNASELQPGDLVFFGGTLSNFEHPGVYAGGGKIWDALNYGIPVQEHTFSQVGLSFVGGVRYWSGGTNPNNPIGSYDAASSLNPGAIRIGGWAFDPNAKTSAVTIHAYVGGPAGSAGAEGHDLGSDNNYRPDVGRTYPGVGDHHGFDFTFTTGKVGTVPVCVYVINIGAGGNTSLGCKTIKVADPDPIGSYDAASSLNPGAIRIGGWAFDPNAKTSAVTIHAYVGGPAGSAGAEGHDLGSDNNYRPDVGRTYPGVGDHHGFDFTFTTGKVGTMPVCVYAINIDLGHNRSLGCRKVSVVAPPPSAKSPPTREETPATKQETPATKVAAGTLRVVHLATVVDGRVRIKVSCEGPTTCRGVARLIVGVNTDRAATGRRSSRQDKAIGKVRYRVPGAAHRVIRMRLNALGSHRMRRAGAAGLRATLVGRHLRNRQVRLRFR